tara:strand:- start:476 stop:694 length:219 start_codon:yes stop_codon:yes gene_type:complete
MKTLENHFTEIKKRALSGECVDCSTNLNDEVFVWVHNKWGNTNFCLELNGVVIKSSKTWTPIVNKLISLINK